MKIKNILTLMVLAAIVLQVSAQSPVVAPAQKKPVILTGGTIHTGTGEVIENGLIAFSSAEKSHGLGKLLKASLTGQVMRLLMLQANRFIRDLFSRIQLLDLPRSEAELMLQMTPGKQAILIPM